MIMSGLRWLVLLVTMFGSVSGARILLMPFPWHSVVNELAYIGSELVNRNHEVHILLPEQYEAMEKFKVTKPHIKMITYGTKYPDAFTTTNEDPTIFFDMLVKDGNEIDLRETSEELLAHCKNLLEDTTMEKKVKDMNFDMVLLSGFPETRCYFVLPYRLGLPYISVTTLLEPWVTRNPSLPSFVPVQLQNPLLTPDMNFWQRLQNFQKLIGWVLYVDQIPTASDELVTKYAPDRPQVSMNHLAGLSLLWLMDNDELIDYPRPMMPNEVNIGGLSVQPAKPLSPDLDTFITSTKEGVIVATFGSIAILPEHIMLKILNGLKMMSADFHIIVRWHIPNKPDVPDNIKLMEYVPQNDILAHPNTKLFVTHCGANGHFEALSHGVPMVNIPIFYDQNYNAKRTDYHGFSKTISVTKFTSEKLYSTMQEVLSNRSYKEKISHASAIFNSRSMSPRERAAFWVEHVMEFGGQHLRAHALDMPAYQYLMLDIVFFLLALLAAGLCATYVLFRFSKRMVGL